jgi:hypothetical protein
LSGQAFTLENMAHLMPYDLPSDVESEAASQGSTEVASSGSNRSAQVEREGSRPSAIGHAGSSATAAALSEDLLYYGLTGTLAVAPYEESLEVLLR